MRNPNVRCSVRSPRTKHEIFVTRWAQIKLMTFEGGRPPCRVRRDMALRFARSEAAKVREQLRKAPAKPATSESKPVIIAPPNAIPRLRVLFGS